MEAEDLDSLIADSLGGVQSALEGERKAAQPAASSQEWAKEAVTELKDASKSDSAAGGPAPTEEFFTNLVKTFQDEKFQQAMASALTEANPLPAEGAAGKSPATTGVVQGPAPPPAAGKPGASSSSGGEGAEEFLQSFLKNFDQAVGSDTNFEKSLTSLMTSMLSNDLICEPLQQIVSKLEPWLKKNQKGLSQADRSRYENQLRLYKQILSVYSSCSNPLPDAAREEVQRLLQELHEYGQPPDEVMNQVSPKEGAAEGNESFEDFVKSMGLDSGLGKTEQDLLQKLSEDPEELTKAMQELSEGIPEEACKQQ